MVVDGTAITLLVVDAIVETELSLEPDDVSVGAFCAEDDTSPLEQLSATRQSATKATIGDRRPFTSTLCSINRWFVAIHRN
ncbi:MAG: hypothetical protein VYD47_04910 [Actinomycetota bacterium]|nr:hypothetical protein [Actinomycetota bacterium]